MSISVEAHSYTAQDVRMAINALKATLSTVGEPVPLEQPQNGRAWSLEIDVEPGSPSDRYPNPVLVDEVLTVVSQFGGMTERLDEAQGRRSRDRFQTVLKVLRANPDWPLPHSHVVGDARRSKSVVIVGAARITILVQVDVCSAFGALAKALHHGADAFHRTSGKECRYHVLGNLSGAPRLQGRLARQSDGYAFVFKHLPQHPYERSRASVRDPVLTHGLNLVTGPYLDMEVPLRVSGCPGRSRRSTVRWDMFKSPKRAPGHGGVTIRENAPKMLGSNGIRRLTDRLNRAHCRLTNGEGPGASTEASLPIRPSCTENRQWTPR